MIPACFKVVQEGETVRIEIDAAVNRCDQLDHAWLRDLAPRRVAISLRQLSAVRSHVVAWMYAVRKALPTAEMELTDVSPGAARALRLVGLERFVAIRKRQNEKP